MGGVQDEPERMENSLAHLGVIIDCQIESILIKLLHRRL